MNTTSLLGQLAETAVQRRLERLKFTIIASNWRTRWCEIDIIAKKHSTIYFVEVKYRQSSSQGDGLAYITVKKLKQMQFSAELWAQNQDWQGQMILMAASVSGPNYDIVELREIIL